MKRREILTGAGAMALAGCAAEQKACDSAGGGETFTWKMVTTWPPNFPGLGTGVVWLARYIEKASGGRMRIKIYAAGELVPAFEVLIRFQVARQRSVTAPLTTGRGSPKLLNFLRLYPLA